MKTQLRELKREQDQLITDLFALSLTFERARKSKNRAAAKRKAIVVNNKLKDNGKALSKLN